MERPRSEVSRYLERVCPGSSIDPLAGDASTRRFYRVTLPGGSRRVLMDYGAPFEGESDDVRLARVFSAAGLPVAGILDTSPQAGCLLLEDLGDRTLESALVMGGAAGPVVPPLLQNAVELAASIADRGTPALRRSERSDGPALDEERFRFEMDFFLENHAVALLGRPAPSPQLRRALHDLARDAAESPRKVLCHRDFHSRNLMVLDDGNLAMVDIQDARWGPDSYDLASLLRDAYVEVEESWIEPLIDHYLGALGESAEPGAFRSRLRRVEAQRMIKALGTFGYQAARRGSDRYVEAAERTVRRLRELLPRSEETRAIGKLLVAEGLL